jgi:hypothetical protein
MTKKNIRSKRIQLSFVIKQDPEEEFVLNFLDLLSPSRRAALIMNLLKKYTQSQAKQQSGYIGLYAKLKEERKQEESILVKKPEMMPVKTVVLREMGETPRELRPEEKKSKLEEAEEFANTFRAAKANLKFLNKNRN